MDRSFLLFSSQLSSRFAVFAALSVMLFCSACGGVSTYQTARPIDPGTTEIGVVFEAASSSEADGVFFGTPQLHVRRGMIDEVDIGLKAGGFGIGADFNYMFIDTNALAVSISPSLVYSGNFVFGDDSGSPDELSGVGTVGAMSWTYFGSLLVDTFSTEYVTGTIGFKGGASSFGGDGEFETVPIFGGMASMKIFIDGVYLVPEFNWITVMADQNVSVRTFGLGLMF
jgi:hypothetical protein